uniref:small monomeric GTPase n=1 Tax=Salmo trutta TaxID=8032 RepID=A0A674D462_SALTR
MASVNDSRLQQQPAQKDAADQNFDYMFKLLIIGNSSVGKTSFLFRYADDSFTSAFVSTVGIDFKVKTVFRNEKRIKLQIWDTAGQERYRTITTAYYRGAMGFLLMYDITNQDSFNAVQDWATQIKTYSWDNAQVILVGNKCELEDDRLVPTEDSQRLAKDLGEYHSQQHAVFAKAIQQEVTLPQHTDLMRTHRYSRGHRTLKPKYLICFS